MQLHCLSRNVSIIDLSSTMTTYQLLYSLTLRGNKLTPRLFIGKATATSDKGSTFLKLDRQKLECQSLVFIIEHSFVNQADSKLARFIEVWIGLIGSKTYHIFPVTQLGQFGQEAFDKEVGNFFTNLAFIHQCFHKIREYTLQLGSFTDITSFQDGTNSHVIIGIEAFPEQLAIHMIATLLIRISLHEQIEVNQFITSGIKLRITITSAYFQNFFVKHFHVLLIMDHLYRW